MEHFEASLLSGFAYYWRRDRLAVLATFRTCSCSSLNWFIFPSTVFCFPAIFYSGRQRSREGGECRPRLKARVFKRFCRHITSCENDKDCKRGNEQCICDEDCGKLCLDPSKWRLKCCICPLNSAQSHVLPLTTAVQALPENDLKSTKLFLGNERCAGEMLSQNTGSPRSVHRRLCGPSHIHLRIFTFLTLPCKHISTRQAKYLELLIKRSRRCSPVHFRFNHKNHRPLLAFSSLKRIGWDLLQAIYIQEYGN